MHGCGQGEVAALGERRDHQSRQAAQILVDVLQPCTGLAQDTSIGVLIPVVTEMPVEKGYMHGNYSQANTIQSKANTVQSKANIISKQG